MFLLQFQGKLRLLPNISGATNIQTLKYVNRSLPKSTSSDQNSSDINGTVKLDNGPYFLQQEHEQADRESDGKKQERASQVGNCQTRFVQFLLQSVQTLARLPRLACSPFFSQAELLGSQYPGTAKEIVMFCQYFDFWGVLIFIFYARLNDSVCGLFFRSASPEGPTPPNDFPAIINEQWPVFSKSFWMASVM